MLPPRRPPAAPMALFALAALMAACGDEEAGEPDSDFPPGFAEPEILDSAGVRVVRNTAPRWTGDEGWRIHPEPDLRIGVADGDEPYRFFRVRAVTALSDGRIAVLDGGSAQLRIFSAEGKHLVSTGSRGDGPGQFQGPRFLERLPGDTLQVTSGTLIRTRFTADGELVAAERMRWERLVGTFRSLLESCTGETPIAVGDHLLLCDQLPTSHLPVTGADPRPREAIMAIAPWDLSAVDTIGRFRIGTEYPVEVRGRLTSRSFTGAPGGRVQITGEPMKIVYMPNSSWRAEIVDVASRRVERVIELEGRMRPITPQELANRGRALLDEDEQDLAPVRRQLPPFPDSVSVAVTAHIDRAGYLWVRQWDPAIPYQGPAPGRWDVFDPDGIFLGVVESPFGIQIREIGTDYILGTTQDDFGVERVVRHLLERRGTASSDPDGWNR